MIDTKELRRLAQAATHPTTKGRWMRLFGERTVYDRLEDGCRGVPIAATDYHPPSPQEAAYLDFIAAANPAVVSELLDRLEAAEKAVTEAYRRGYATGQEEIEKERDALRAAVRHEADCVGAAKAEIDALRAKIERADRLEKVESALSDLLNDLEERAKWNLEASQRVVACGNGVYVRAKAALEESK